MNYEDNELIYYVKENDDYGLELLLNKYNPLIIKFAKKINTEYKIDYDDLVQEGRLALVTAIKKYNDTLYSAKFSSYVYSCIKYHLYNLVKREYNNKRIINYVKESLDDQVSDGVNMNYYEVISDDSNSLPLTLLIGYEEYMGIMNKLDDTESLLYDLKLNYFSNEEIIKLLDISYKKLYNLLYCLRKKLRNRIIGEE